VAEDIEEQTRDYILKKLAQELKGGSFEDFIANLLRVMGYKTRSGTRARSRRRADHRSMIVGTVAQNTMSRSG
jgi:hypothetical protein